MKKFVLCMLLFVLSDLSFSQTKAMKTLTLHVEIPEIDVDPYFRPYIAVWLETSRREPIETLALWYQLPSETATEDGRKWLKDLRQWWRKIGRQDGDALDGVTGATRKPGDYRIAWDYSKLVVGEYFMHIEASREEGGRSFKRIPVRINDDLSLSLEKNIIASDGELGKISVKVN